MDAMDAGHLRAHDVTLSGERVVLRPMTERDWPLVEAINNVDMPGYFAATADIAADLVAGASAPAVRLQLDQYHVGMAGDDVREMLRKHQALIEHVQIADVPGRHQPGTGEQPIKEFLADLDAMGYPGAVGLEYRPLGSTEESLSWLPREARA